MTDRDVATLSDDDLDQRIEHKKVVVARAASLRDAAEAECKRLIELHATAEAEESSEAVSLAQARTEAERSRNGRLGALANAQRLLDLALTEQAMRAARGAEAEAVAARESLKLHVQSMARVALEALKAMAGMREALRERAQTCRTLDNTLRATTGAHVVQHILTLDEYGDRVQLESASYGLAEVVQVLTDYEAGQLGAQITHRNAAAARERATSIAQQGVAG